MDDGVVPDLEQDPEALFTSLLEQGFFAPFRPLLELVKHMGEDEGEEFLAGFRNLMHRLTDVVFQPEPDDSEVQTVLADVSSYLESWLVSAKLDGNAEWREQMAESAELVATGVLGPSVDAEEVRRRLVS